MTVGDFHLGRVFHMTAGRSDSYSPPLEGRWNAASSVASAARLAQSTLEALEANRLQGLKGTVTRAQAAQVSLPPAWVDVEVQQAGLPDLQRLRFKAQQFDVARF